MGNMQNIRNNTIRTSLQGSQLSILPPPPPLFLQLEQLEPHYDQYHLYLLCREIGALSFRGATLLTKGTSDSVLHGLRKRMHVQLLHLLRAVSVSRNPFRA